MILVDTSVWIDYLRQRETPATNALEEIMERSYPFGLSGIIYQEILQGAVSPEDFDRLVEYFGSQRFYHPVDPVESYAAAGALYCLCRRNGVTIRSSIDCLIAQIAIENDLSLLQSDRDFVGMQAVVSELRLFSY